MIFRIMLSKLQLFKKKSKGFKTPFYFCMLSNLNVIIYQFLARQVFALKLSFFIFEQKISFSLEELANELNLSKSQSYTKIKSLTGQTPNELLRRIRLERAYQLLETVSAFINEVGLQSVYLFHHISQNVLKLIFENYQQMWQ